MAERSFAQVNRNHPLGSNFEATLASATPFLYPTTVALLARQ